MKTSSFNAVIDAITAQIDKFLDVKAIYSENNKQDFDPPCVYIKLLESNSDYRLHNRRIRTFPFDVMYFTDKGNDDLNYTGDYLYDILELLEIGDYSVWATELRYEVTDDVLHFLVTYKVEVDRLEEFEKFTELKTDTEVNYYGD